MTVYPFPSVLVAELLEHLNPVVAKYVVDTTAELTEQDRHDLGLSYANWEEFRRWMSDYRIEESGHRHISTRPSVRRRSTGQLGGWERTPNLLVVSGIL